MNMRRMSLLILWMLFAVMPAHAQDYIYSVTMGTAWARMVYPREEIKQRKLNAELPRLEGAPEFSRIFSEMYASYRLYNKYNDSIFVRSSHEKWIDMFKRRARTYSNIYSDNNQRITTLRDYFAGSNVPDAAYDSLYYWTRNYYFHNFNDVYLYEQFTDILIPHYEALSDMEHLVFCYLCAGAYSFQCSRMGDAKMAQKALDYFNKVIALKSNFPTFRDPLNRYYLISAFINLSLLYNKSADDMRKSQELMNELSRIYAQEASQAVLASDSLLNAYSHWSHELLNFRSIANYIGLGLEPSELSDQLYAQYIHLVDSLNCDLDHLPNRYYARLSYDHLLIQAYMGKITWDKALREFEKKIDNDEDIHFANGKSKLKINYLNNLTQTYFHILEHSSRSEEQKRKLVKTHLDQVLNIILHYDHATYPVEKGTILAKMATNPILLKYLDSKERRDLLFRLIVVEQPTTYVHVSMVADLSRLLAESMIDSHPEYFVGVPGIGSIDDVKNKRAALLEFVYDTAIFHDLGKISMPNIINNCFRKLTESEYALIKLHPEMSLPYFEIDPSLLAYQDVAMGHHKWFDGDGYPSTFYNRRSPYFPIINIVTICDCMDAATENIGRNYHRPKSFDAVLKEFDEESGERYDPQLINQIHSDSLLYDLINATVNIGRYNHYYLMYMSYIDQRDQRKR